MSSSSNGPARKEHSAHATRYSIAPLSCQIRSSIIDITVLLAMSPLLDRSRHRKVNNEQVNSLENRNLGQDARADCFDGSGVVARVTAAFTRAEAVSSMR